MIGVLELNSGERNMRLVPGKWGPVRSSPRLDGLVLAFCGGNALPFMGVRGPLYVWLVRGIPAPFVALGLVMLIEQFQLYRYQGYGEAAFNRNLSARKIFPEP